MLHCILLDCSASMLQGRRLALAKGLLLRWTAGFYRRREDLAVIGFSGQQARVLQPPRKAVAFNEAWIAAIPGGGGTPARSAVALADALLRKRRRSTPEQHVALWLLTDARFDDIPPRPRDADICTVVDFDDAAVALGRAARIGSAWGADVVRAADLA
ncbi:vWA domain-containing protein [Thauera linaloolentis]|uniref:vWA domain-containing protein n=1 Tax=Thauera linaloolentis TaxID=76112 RepID=UPI0002E07FDB|nr:VWA domain-containing protein [Thauera linaloolentis]MCM8564420.1 VWA domain-containing protein [Thauera linaloolentis]